MILFKPRKKFKAVNAVKSALASPGQCRGINYERFLTAIADLLILNSIYGICPATDPNLIGMSTVNQLETVLDTPFDTCGSYLSEFPCNSKLGFPLVAGGVFYGPDNLPSSGTATLSNLGGTVTSPASGTVFTYTNAGDGVVYTISAANVQIAGSESETQTTVTDGGGSGNSAKTSPGSPTETGSSASAGGNTKTGWGNKAESSSRLLYFTAAGSLGYAVL